MSLSKNIATVVNGDSSTLSSNLKILYSFDESTVQMNKNCSRSWFKVMPHEFKIHAYARFINLFFKISIIKLNISEKINFD